MRRLLPFLLLPLLAPSALAQSPASSWRVTNRTGQAANGLIATEAGATNPRGRNRLREPLADGAEKRFRRKAEAPCRLDLRLRLADGREAVISGHDVCAQPAVLFEPSSIQAASGRSPAAARGNTGTGFLVAPERVMTNQHVVDGCARITLRAPSGYRFNAVAPVQANRELDLAVLHVPGLTGPTLPFRAEAPRRGEDVITYGHPLAGVLSADPKLTRGEVSGLGGFRGDPTRLQFSAPLQPGNSGGPLLDMRARVVGITTASLGGRRSEALQNVNFAVKSDRAIAFLRAAGVTPALGADSTPERGAVEVGETANRAVYLIQCEKTPG
ncbi:Trypsin-like peptidase domain-containing protein [Roseomonas rosea]|uniref:Serine protease n=1 Tax=Muricoccus roseus TaxID=198092 RepID=A0A1M6FTE3_9PROT|nr:trypsin-like peptidase domain-containing protein [Roseomonas rosea]SHJ00971.1 Trypsin-like peptidase domain-containing protein [Roseomonas rosea]